MYKIGDVVDLELEVRKEHLNFDLEKFMKGNGASTGAIALITPKQVVMTDCFVRKVEDPSFGEHGVAMDDIYSIVYNNKTKLPNNWYSSILNDGNIFIQLCFGCCSLIWIPEKISMSQYNALVMFNEKIKEIYWNNKEYFDDSPMSFRNNLLSGESFNSIDLFLEEIKDEIADVDMKEENIVGSNIEQLNFSLDNLFFSGKSHK